MFYLILIILYFLVFTDHTSFSIRRTTGFLFSSAPFLCFFYMKLLTCTSGDLDKGVLFGSSILVQRSESKNDLIFSSVSIRCHRTKNSPGGLARARSFFMQTTAAISLSRLVSSASIQQVWIKMHKLKK